LPILFLFLILGLVRGEVFLDREEQQDKSVDTLFSFPHFSRA